jgi:membrane protease YdiL (CAAX protease family)
MAALSLIVATLFVLYVTLVRPLLSRKRYQKFLRDVVANPALRTRYYLRILGEQWLWLVVIGAIVLLGSVPPSTLGLRAPDNWANTLLLVVEVMVVLPIALVVALRRIAKTQRPGLAKLLLAVKELLPHTSQERRLWLLVSVTAGICEEIVFRGFLPWYFLVVGTFFKLEVSVLTALVLSSIFFGFAHIYQGWKGALGTGLLGAILAYLYVNTGSLILPIVCHILMDARIVFFAPILLKLDQRPKVSAGI